MTIRSVSVNIGQASSRYEIRVGNGELRKVGTWARRCLGRGCRRVAIVSNARVCGLYGEAVREALAGAGFDTATHLIGDGERFKSLRTLERTLAFLSENGISRTDAVVALGGGVVGDLAGFAASVYLRGVPFLQIPTTLLSMIDSSVGGKTGVNTSFGKNLVGSFYQPAGVLIDIRTIATLPRRELTAGFCEAIKQGAIADRQLLDRTAAVLHSGNAAGLISDERRSRELVDLIARQIDFKREIVEGDERESVGNKGRRSRKILNFGHTFGHALEKVTEYKYLKHGEAVGYGIRFAAALSNKLELLGRDEVELLNDVVHRAGKFPPIRNIRPPEILAAFGRDKKVINDSLQWVLLKGIGKPVIVPDNDIPRSVLVESVREMIEAG